MMIKYRAPIEIGRTGRVVRNDLSRHGLRRLNLVLGEPKPDWLEWVTQLSMWDEGAQGWYMDDKGLGMAKVFLIWHPAGEVVELDGHPGVMWYVWPGVELWEVIARAAERFEEVVGRKAVRALTYLTPNPFPEGKGRMLPTSSVGWLPERIVIAV